MTIAKALAQAFLSYQFPETMSPDGGLTLSPLQLLGDGATMPRGTNLLNADEAEAMMKDLLDQCTVNGIFGSDGEITLNGYTLNVIEHAGGNLQEICFALASQAGWWTEYTERAFTDPVFLKHFIAGKIALIQSEASEALEGHRKDLMDDHLPHRKMIEVELADVIIRTMDLAGALGLDIGGAIAEKLAYNQQRADHKPEARAAAGGKSL